MKNTVKSISFEEVLQNKELSHLHEVVHFLEETKDQDLFPNKQTAYFKDAVSQRVQTLYSENSTMPIKKVITSVLENFTENLDEDIILKIIKWTIHEWSNLSDVSPSKKNALQLEKA